MQSLQVTLGSGTQTAIVPQSAGGTPTQLYTSFQQLMFQNNSTHNMRVGDATVTSTKGIVLLANGGSLTLGSLMEYSSDLSEWYVAGTAADVLDILFIA